MTPAERIAEYQREIEWHRKHIEWLEKTGFTINPGVKPGPCTNADMIEREKENIAMYEAMIAKLNES